MRAVLTGDWHLEAGSHLGMADASWGSSRIQDAHEVLGQIAQEECDLLVFLGDLGRTAAPGPVAYKVAQDALRASKAKAIVGIPGNHDWTGQVATPVHIAARGTRMKVSMKPEILTTPGGLQIGTLPWTPPQRLLSHVGHRPAELAQLVADRLIEVARGLGAQLDRSKPSILVGHWHLAGAEGAEHLADREPVLRGDDLIAAGFDVVVCGHNHQRAEVFPNVWHTGPPMRGGFGDTGATGYLVAEWRHVRDTMEGPNVWKATVRPVDTKDRPLLTLDLDIQAVLEGTWSPPSGLTGAVLRVRGSCTEDQARLLAQGPGERLVEALYAQGCFKVVGPQLRVERVRRVRTDLTTDVDPMSALDRYLDQQEIPEEIRPAVREEARKVLAGG